MRRLLFSLVAGMSLSVAAHAQNAVVNFQSGQVLTSAQLMTMQKGFVNTSGGTLTNGTIPGTNASAAMSLANGAMTSRALAAWFGDTVNVLAYEAACDAKTDDTAAFNRALAAAGSSTSLGGGHKTVVVPGGECVISGEVDLPTGVSLRGAGFTSTLLDFGPSSTIVYKAVNGQSASTVSDLGIQYTAGDPGTAAKYALDMASQTPSMAVAHDIYVINAHYAIDLSGNNDYLDRIHIIGNHGVGIRIGNFTTQAGTVDPRVTNTTIVGDYQPGGTTSSAIGMLIYDAGGLYLTNNDILYGKYGTDIIPGANQQITWMFADNTVLGDTTQGDMLHIDTTASTAQILGLNFSNSWTSNGQGTPVWAGNDGGGTFKGISFNNHRALSGVNDTFHFDAGITNIRVNASTMCGDGSGSAVYVNSGDTNVSVTGNDMSLTCTSNPTSNTRNGVSLGGSNNNVTVTVNNIPVSAVPIFVGQQSTTANINIANNIPASNQSYAVASAATIDLPNAQDAYAITGTTAITNMTSAWAGRHVMVYSSSGLTFQTGGTSGTAMCNAVTAAANVPVYAVYHGCWYLSVAG